MLRIFSKPKPKRKLRYTVVIGRTRSNHVLLRTARKKAKGKRGAKIYKINTRQRVY